MYNSQMSHNAKYNQSEILRPTFLPISATAELCGHRLTLHVYLLVLLLQRQNLHLQVLPAVALLEQACLEVFHRSLQTLVLLQYWSHLLQLPPALLEHLHHIL